MVIMFLGGMMFSKLKPDYYYKDIFDIDFLYFKEKGYQGIICDIDNTIIPWSDKEPLREVIDWLEELEKMGFSLCLVSNGRKRRVKEISDYLGIPAVGQAAKPTRSAYRQAIKRLGMGKDKILVLGDQIFTDILGGNRVGLKTILVDPMDKEEFITTKMLRFLEKIIYQREGA